MACFRSSQYMFRWWAFWTYLWLDPSVQKLNSIFLLSCQVKGFIYFDAILWSKCRHQIRKKLVNQKKGKRQTFLQANTSRSSQADFRPSLYNNITQLWQKGKMNHITTYDKWWCVLAFACFCFCFFQGEGVCGGEVENKRQPGRSFNRRWKWIVGCW